MCLCHLRNQNIVRKSRINSAYRSLYPSRVEMVSSSSVQSILSPPTHSPMTRLQALPVTVWMRQR